MKRRSLLLGIDLFWVALSPFIALFIRENFAPREETLAAALGYALAGLVAGAIVLPLAGLNRGFWRYTSLPDLMRLAAAATAIVLLALFATFAFSRLTDVARSIPLIQWFVLLTCMMGSRIAIRLWRERRGPPSREFVRLGDTQNVLIVGINQIAELYLRSVADFAPRRFSIAGILAAGAEVPGRILRSHKVLGQPEDVAEVVRQLEVHGSPIDRVVVVEPASRLSRRAVDALLDLERSSPIPVEWITELLGFDSRQERKDTASTMTAERPAVEDQTSLRPAGQPLGWYSRVKRIVDLLVTPVLIVVVAPLAAVVAIRTALDIGLPIVFWQKRPGRFGHPFKLYKFRSMRGAHDQEGRRLSDQERASRFGTRLRHTRLDELPQFYNVVVGEMSLIGPRPLLPVDHGPGGRWRLLVRPGLTGWAQVNGGRLLSAEDKWALDVWYVQNMSLWLDVKIGLRTLVVPFVGEKVNREAVARAREALIRLEREQTPAAIIESRQPATGATEVAGEAESAA